MNLFFENAFIFNSRVLSRNTDSNVNCPIELSNLVLQAFPPGSLESYRLVSLIKVGAKLGDLSV